MIKFLLGGIAIGFCLGTYFWVWRFKEIRNELNKNEKGNKDGR